MRLTRLMATRKGESYRLTGQFRGSSGYRVRLHLAELGSEEELRAAVEQLTKKDLTVGEARRIGTV